MALIRRGIHLDTHGADDGAAVFGRLAEAARAAEDAGFDAISVPDHIYDPGGPALPMFEAYTVLGALAAVTSSATLLTLASPVTLREPGLLAKAVYTSRRKCSPGPIANGGWLSLGVNPKCTGESEYSGSTYITWGAVSTDSVAKSPASCCTLLKFSVSVCSTSPKRRKNESPE